MKLQKADGRHGGQRAEGMLTDQSANIRTMQLIGEYPQGPSVVSSGSANRITAIKIKRAAVNPDIGVSLAARVRDLRDHTASLFILLAFPTRKRTRPTSHESCD